MKKIKFRHYENGLILGGYKNIEEFDYVYLAIDQFGGEELKSTDGSIIYCPRIDADIFGICVHEIISVEPVKKYEKDKDIMKILRQLNIDRDRMAYLLLWTCYCASNLSRTRLAETKYQKFVDAISLIKNFSETETPDAYIMISNGKKGRGGSVKIQDLESIKIVGKTLSEFFLNNISEREILKITPSEGTTIDKEDDLTDKTKHRFFYEVIDWFIKQHREKNGMSLPIAGINHDWIISRLAWLFGIANDNYKDGGLNGSWK